MIFYADLSALSQIMTYVREAAKQSGIGTKAIGRIELACEEAIVNVISYAYPDQKGELFVECHRHGNRFEITVRDNGVAFNPIDAELNPSLDKSMQERPIGGLGLFLLRKTIDEVSYQRVDKENILRLAFLI